MVEKKRNKKIPKRNEAIALFLRIRTAFLIVICLFSGIKTISSQQIDLDLIKLNCEAASIEKIYVHTASPSVSAGGKFLYKAYLHYDPESITKESSNILYFDILNWENKVVFHWKSGLEENMLSGQVTIPDTISTGIYQFRAYTNWMLNKGFNYAFQTPVLIYNFRDENLQHIPKAVYKKDLHNLIKANSGRNIAIKTSQQNDKLKIHIIDHENNLNLYDSYSILGFQSDKQIFNRKFRKQNINTPIQVISDLKPGNLALFLVDQNNNLIAQHYIPIDLKNKPELTLNNEFAYSPPNKKVVLDLSCKNLEHNEKLYLSCTIREKDSLIPFENKFRIDNYINYFSEIDASTWFGKSINSVSDVLNNESWIWSDFLVNGDINCNFAKENNHSLIRGFLLNSETNKYLENCLIIATFSNDKPIFDYCFTNSGGEFFFWLNEYYNNKKIYFLAAKNDTLLNNVKWEIASNIHSNQQLLQNHLKSLTESQKKYLNKFHQLEMMNQIYHKPEVNNTIGKKLNDSIYRYIPDIIVYPDDFFDLANFQEVADNILPGVFFKKKKSNWEIKIYNSDFRDNVNVGGTIFLNGIPFYDYNYIATIQKESIERIEIYRDNLIYGNINFNGILAIYTKDKQIPDSYSSQPGVMTFFNQVTKTDKSPIMKKHAQMEKSPNFERILYWNSSLSPEKQNFELDFYTSKLKTDYIIDIEGVTSNGRYISYQHEFSVK
jgi:hypothetical protein